MEPFVPAAAVAAVDVPPEGEYRYTGPSPFPELSNDHRNWLHIIANQPKEDDPAYQPHGPRIDVVPRPVAPEAVAVPKQEVFQAGPSVLTWPNFLASTIDTLQKVKNVHDRYVQVVPIKKREKAMREECERAGYDIQEHALKEYIAMLARDYPDVPVGSRMEVAEALAFIFVVNRVAKVKVEDKITVDKVRGVTRVEQTGRNDGTNVQLEKPDKKTQRTLDPVVNMQT